MYTAITDCNTALCLPYNDEETLTEMVSSESNQEVESPVCQLPFSTRTHFHGNTTSSHDPEVVPRHRSLHLQDSRKRDRPGIECRRAGRRPDSRVLRVYNLRRRAMPHRRSPRLISKTRVSKAEGQEGQEVLASREHYCTSSQSDCLAHRNISILNSNKSTSLLNTYIDQSS